MAATDNDALLKAMDQLMKEEDRASVIEYAKQLSTKGGDVVGTMRKMSQQGVDTKKEAAMWKKRALITAAVAVVVCAVMFGLMVAAAEVTKEQHITRVSPSGSGRRLANPTSETFGTDEFGNMYSVTTPGEFVGKEKRNRRLTTALGLEDHANGDAKVIGWIVTKLPARALDDDGRQLRLTEMHYESNIKVTTHVREAEEPVVDGNGRQLPDVSTGGTAKAYACASGMCIVETPDETRHYDDIAAGDCTPDLVIRRNLADVPPAGTTKDGNTYIRRDACAGLAADCVNTGDFGPTR